MKEKLAALLALQELDSRLDVVSKKYKALDPGRAEQEAFQAARTAHQQAEAALHATDGALKDAELEQKSVEIKKAEFEAKLYGGKVQVPKELQAMQEEIEMLGRQRSRLDEKILTLMEAREADRAREAQTQLALSEAQSALSSVQAAYKETAQELADRARSLLAQRPETLQQVPPDLQTRYAALRAAKGGIAVVPLVDGNACGGCNTGLPGELVRRIRQGAKIELCENCGRIVCEARTE